MGAPHVEFEVVREAPLEAIVDLYRAGGWWEESAHNRAIIPRMIRGSFCFMVARSGDRIVGMGRAISDGASDAYIQDVVVLPEFRGHGLGRELVRRLTQFCVERELDWIGLIAEPGTGHFYDGLGFRALEGYQPMRHGKHRS
jgi:spermidine synthase